MVDLLLARSYTQRGGQEEHNLWKVKQKTCSLSCLEVHFETRSLGLVRSESCRRTQLGGGGNRLKFGFMRRTKLLDGRLGFKTKRTQGFSVDGVRFGLCGVLRSRHFLVVLRLDGCEFRRVGSIEILFVVIEFENNQSLLGRKEPQKETYRERSPESDNLLVLRSHHLENLRLKPDNLSLQIDRRLPDLLHRSFPRLFQLNLQLLNGCLDLDLVLDLQLLQRSLMFLLRRHFLIQKSLNDRLMFSLELLHQSDVRSTKLLQRLSMFLSFSFKNDLDVTVHLLRFRLLQFGQFDLMSPNNLGFILLVDLTRPRQKSFDFVEFRLGFGSLGGESVFELRDLSGGGGGRFG